MTSRWKQLLSPRGRKSRQTPADGHARSGATLPSPGPRLSGALPWPHLRSPRSPAARQKLLAQVCDAAFKGDHARLRLLLATQVDVNAHEPHAGATPLWLACLGGHAACVQLLLAANAQTDAASKDGATPLTMCCINGHAECAQLLLGAGADASRRTSQGYTALFAAAQFGHAACVALLVAAGVPPQQPADDGSTALYIACQNGHAECVRCLIDAKADLQRGPAADGASPLLTAAAHSHD